MRYAMLIAAACGSLLSVQAAAEPAAPAADDNEIVCKKEPEIGKLVKKKRCFTRAEWTRISESHRRLGARLQQEGASFFDGGAGCDGKTAAGALSNGC